MWGAVEQRSRFCEDRRLYEGRYLEIKAELYAGEDQSKLFLKESQTDGQLHLKSESQSHDKHAKVLM